MAVMREETVGEGVVGRALPTLISLYMARGRPDKWLPWTRADHRRVMTEGCWVCEVPEDDSNGAFWRSRRRFALLQERLCEAEPIALANSEEGHALLNRSTTMPKHTSQKAAILMFDDELGMGDDYPTRWMEDEMGAGWNGGVQVITELHKLRLLNQYLGKAGGLNFVLEALLHVEGVKHQSLDWPLFMSVLDARHTCDKQWWLTVLPAFHEVGLRGKRSEVLFAADIAIAQVAAQERPLAD